MRRFLAVLTLCLAALPIAACGGSGGGSAAANVPAVSGAYGSDPLISLPGVKPPGGLLVQTLVHGSGPVVKPSDYVMFNVEGKVWAGDRLVIDSFTDRRPQGLPLRAGLPAWRRLAGQRVGSRVLMVVPPKDGFGARGNSSINVTGTDTLVFVFDILATMPATAHATGTVVPYQPTASMPRVTVTSRGPQIAVPAHAKPPTKLVDRVLLSGHGPPVAAGQTIITQYEGVVWRTRKEFNSSWLQGSPQAFELSKSQVIKGWLDGLAGQRVGSRVLLEIPPKLGYGKSGNPPLVKGTDTLVYVVDILAIVPN